jgi:hypothetical protein
MGHSRGSEAAKPELVKEHPGPELEEKPQLENRDSR